MQCVYVAQVYEIKYKMTCLDFSDFQCRVNLLQKKKAQLTTQRKWVSPCGTKTGRGLLLPGHCPQVTVQQSKKKEKKESARNGGQTRANRRTLTGWRELQCCVEICPLVQMRLVQFRAPTRTSFNFFRLFWRIAGLLALALLLKLPLREEVIFTTDSFISF